MLDTEERFDLDGREVVVTPEMHVSCDGDGGPLGHPREYLTLEKGGEVACLYCSRLYIHTSNPRAEEIRRSASRSD